jgi:CBS domain-containing protein
MVDGNSETKGCKYSIRDCLALLLTILGVVLLFILALRVGCCDSNASSGPGFALVTILPVIGTWVGTVLAFYFSKENFEAASKSVIASAAQSSSEQRLSSMIVTSAMIQRDALLFVPVPNDKPLDALTFKDALNLMTDKGRNRLPVLDANNAPLYMLHRSALEGYISDLLLKPQPKGTAAAASIDLGKLKLTELWQNDALKFRNAFGVVSAKATMADAKQEMDKVGFRQDVFVTERGTAQEPILGLITNIEIEKQSRA